MRKPITTTLTMFAVVCALAVTVMAGNGNNGNGNGNGNTGNGQNKNTFVDESVDREKTNDEAGNNGFALRQDVCVDVVLPEADLIVGGMAYVEFTITNISGRAIPDITFRAVDMIDNKNYKGEILGYDSYDKPYYSISLSDGETSEPFSVLLDTSTAGTFHVSELLTFDFEIWTRYGNKNFQDRLFSSVNTADLFDDGDGWITIEEPQPGLPPGFKYEDGNLKINTSVLNGALPMNANFGSVTILFGDEYLSGASDNISGPSQFSYDGDWLTMKAGALQEGFYTIEASREAHGNRPASDGSVTFSLFIDGYGNIIVVVIE